MADDNISVGKTPIAISASPGMHIRVYNAGAGTLYYKGSPDVSVASHEGVLAPTQSFTYVKGVKWFVSTDLKARIFVTRVPESVDGMVARSELEELNLQVEELGLGDLVDVDTDDFEEDDVLGFDGAFYIKKPGYLWMPDPTGADDTDLLNGKLHDRPGRRLHMPPGGSYKAAGNLDELTAGHQLVGAGREAGDGGIEFSGNGTEGTPARLFDLAGLSRVRLQDIRLTLADAALHAALVRRSNAFGTSIAGSFLQGTNGVNLRAGQIGIEEDSNAGDNKLLDTFIGNFGAGLKSNSQLSYAWGCQFGTNVKGVWLSCLPDDFAAGLSLLGCTINSVATGLAGAMTHGIHVDGAANEIWLDHLWIESADQAIVVGDEVKDGPFDFRLHNSKIQGVTRTLDVVSAQNCNIENVRLSGAGGGATDLIRVNSTHATRGICRSITVGSGYTLAADVPLSAFPPTWDVDVQGANPDKIKRFASRNPIVLTEGTDTALVAGEIFWADIPGGIQNNVVVTGLEILVGSVGGTDKIILFIADREGNIVGTTSLEGTTLGTAGNLQRIALITPVSLARGAYKVGVQGNGATGKIRTLAAGFQATKKQAGEFGVIPKLTLTTLFNAGQGPYVATYGS